ncbi:hypothetical protein, partial [Rhodobacter capsulatus]|uniref:hypothetical protein n=1 Tax=Rhodobacter capsulatus TaxID=1061 RepID=UPI001F3FBE07
EMSPPRPSRALGVIYALHRISEALPEKPQPRPDGPPPPVTIDFDAAGRIIALADPAGLLNCRPGCGRGGGSRRRCVGS